MDAADLRAALAQLGMSQCAFARRAGVNPRTVRRWVAGACPVPGPVAALVAALLGPQEVNR